MRAHGSVLEAPLRPRKRWLLASAGIVLAISALLLAWNISENPVGSSYIDPIAAVRAQDEVTYVNAAMRMTTDHDWMNPKFKGRLFLFKPPLIIWMASISQRLFGLSLISIRLPSLLLGAAGVAAVFLWISLVRSIAAASLGAAALLLSPFWQLFSRLCLTDILCASFATLALVPMAWDPSLRLHRTRAVVGVMGAASVLSKSVAGLLPFLAIALFAIVIIPELCPRMAALAEIALIATIVIAPWHLYQLIQHPQWFWADYVQEQLFAVGMNGIDGSTGHPMIFYLKRLAVMDPVIAIFGVLGVFGLPFRELRKSPVALLAVCWLIVTAAALSAFRTTNLPYIAFLLPSLCIVGGVGSPTIMDRRMAVTCVIASLMLFRLGTLGRPWSLRPFTPPLEGAKAMRAYLDLHRTGGLINVDPDDGFYSVILPLQNVRYCFLDPQDSIRRLAPHYGWLGILLTQDEFLHIGSLKDGFALRLRAWGLNSTEPIATGVSLRNISELSEIIKAHPEADFYLPTNWLPVQTDPEASHDLLRYSNERVFLMSRIKGSLSAPDIPLPPNW